MAGKNFKHVFIVLTSSILTSNLQSLQKKHLFLDLKVGFENSTIIINLYVKSTDRHQYLCYFFAHPNHTKQSVVFSQILRISKSCSSEENCIKYKANMKSWNEIM